MKHFINNMKIRNKSLIDFHQKATVHINSRSTKGNKRIAWLERNFP